MLVTGATGFIGAHVVDELLRRGIKVKGTTRSSSKARQMCQDRPEHANMLDFDVITDLAHPGVFDEAAQGVDAIIHVASVGQIIVADSFLDFAHLVSCSLRPTISPTMNGSCYNLRSKAPRQS